MMEEKKNQREDHSHNQQNQEPENSDFLTNQELTGELDQENESGDVSHDHKKEKGNKSKHSKEETIESLEKEVAVLNDKYLRLYSEFDNYRKRSIRERIELGKSAAAELITTLLPVLDDFERAIKAMETAGESSNTLSDGIVLIYTKFKNVLAQQGLEPMKAMGEVFDTDFHEAVTNIPAPAPDMKGKVVDVIQKGYLLGGKVIRYAKVVVGS
jgi:molecular chaperone GrpE